MASQWFVKRGPQEAGPFTARQLRELAASNRMSALTLVRKDGVSEWVPAGKVHGLMPETPPPPPSLHDGAASTDGADDAQRHGAGGSSAGASRRPSKSRAKPKSSRPRRVSRDAPVWYVYDTEGITYGPISKRELDQWAAEHRIDAGAQLCREGDEAWQPATSIYHGLATPDDDPAVNWDDPTHELASELEQKRGKRTRPRRG